MNHGDRIEYLKDFKVLHNDEEIELKYYALDATVEKEGAGYLGRIFFSVERLLNVHVETFKDNYLKVQQENPNSKLVTYFGPSDLSEYDDKEILPFYATLVSGRDGADFHLESESCYITVPEA